MAGASGDWDPDCANQLELDRDFRALRDEVTRWAIFLAREELGGLVDGCEARHNEVD